MQPGGGCTWGAQIVRGAHKGWGGCNGSENGRGDTTSRWCPPSHSRGQHALTGRVAQPFTPLSCPPPYPCAHTSGVQGWVGVGELCPPPPPPGCPRMGRTTPAPDAVRLPSPPFAHAVVYAAPLPSVCTSVACACPLHVHMMGRGAHMHTNREGACTQTERGHAHKRRGGVHTNGEGACTQTEGGRAHDKEGGTHVHTTRRGCAHMNREARAHEQGGGWHTNGRGRGACTQRGGVHAKGEGGAHGGAGTRKQGGEGRPCVCRPMPNWAQPQPMREGQAAGHSGMPLMCRPAWSHPAPHTQPLSMHKQAAQAGCTSRLHKQAAQAGCTSRTMHEGPATDMAAHPTCRPMPNHTQPLPMHKWDCM
jgi:hypothetical protein